MSDQQGIHLTCQGEAVLALMHELNTQFDAMEDLAVIVDQGMSRKQGQGFIELAWMGEADPEFLEELERDPRVLDVCVYTIPKLSDEQYRLLEVV